MLKRTKKKGKLYSSWSGWKTRNFVTCLRFMGTWSKKPIQENLVKIVQVLDVIVDYLVGNLEEKSDELDNIELLFRMNSKGLTEEEKAIFKKELIEFMEERKKAFKKGDLL